MPLDTDYIGCMKQGEVFSDVSVKWYEPQHSLLGGHYFTHVWGSSYVVSGRAAAAITTLPVGLLRFFANEGMGDTKHDIPSLLCSNIIQTRRLGAGCLRST